MLFALLTFVIVGLLVHEGFRRFEKLSWFVFLILPILLTPVWFSIQQTTDWFVWIKAYSAIFACSFMLALRFTSLKKKKWPFFVAYAIAVANLFEAITRVLFASTELPNLLIAASGFLLIVTLPFVNSIRVDPRKFNDFYWDTPYSWILGYTIWDWVFVYLAFPKDSAAQVAMLLVPLIASLKNNQLYLQARACTLAFYLMTLLTFPNINKMVLVQNENNYWAALISSILATLWIGFQRVSTK